jgi:hypothetical protein
MSQEAKNMFWLTRVAKLCAIGIVSEELGEWSALNKQRSFIVYYPQPYSYSRPLFYPEVGDIRFFYQTTPSHIREC